MSSLPVSFFPFLSSSPTTSLSRGKSSTHLPKITQMESSRGSLELGLFGPISLAFPSWSWLPIAGGIGGQRKSGPTWKIYNSWEAPGRGTWILTCPSNIFSFMEVLDAITRISMPFVGLLLMCYFICFFQSSLNVALADILVFFGGGSCNFHFIEEGVEKSGREEAYPKESRIRTRTQIWVWVPPVLWTFHSWM